VVLAGLTDAEALTRWPQDRQLFLLHYFGLLENGRPADAAAFIRDPSHRPRVVTQDIVERMARIADALASRQGMAEVQETTRRTTVAVKIENAQLNALVMALAGMTDELFEFLYAYFLGGTVNGQSASTPGPLDPRPTSMMFSPPVLALRGDPRFATLLARTGLENYWRKSGTQPDFRRQADADAQSVTQPIQHL
jgi:hypothetical protein